MFNSRNPMMPGRESPINSLSGHHDDSFFRSIPNDIPNAYLEGISNEMLNYKR